MVQMAGMMEAGILSLSMRTLEDQWENLFVRSLMSYSTKRYMGIWAVVQPCSGLMTLRKMILKTCLLRYPMRWLILIFN